MLSDISILKNFEGRLAQRVKGFSMVELLITLAILGLCAAFTVPQLFQTSSTNQSSKYTAMAKDTTFMVINAYEQYRAANGSVTNSVGISYLTPYMNYVKTDATAGTTVDQTYGNGTRSCNAFGGTCLKLHNGATIMYWNIDSFGSSGSTTLNAVPFQVDPDGRVTNGGTTNSDGKALALWLYRDGTIRTDAQVLSGTTYYNGSVQNMVPLPAQVPPWFTGF